MSIDLYTTIISLKSLFLKCSLTCGRAVAATVGGEPASKPRLSCHRGARPHHLLVRLEAPLALLVLHLHDLLEPVECLLGVAVAEEPL